MTITAIPTHYDGHTFRSRLEARWAVFFNELGVPWRFEPRAFDVPDGRGAYRRYLPDFYLPEEHLWVEVKGSDSRADWGMWGRFVGGDPDTRHLLILGDVPGETDRQWLHPIIWGVDRVGWLYWRGPGAPGGDVGFYRLSDADRAVPGGQKIGGRANGTLAPQAVVEAYRDARSARFDSVPSTGLTPEVIAAARRLLLP